MKKIILILFMLFILKINVSALMYGGCEYSEVSRMKKVVTNINYTYNYRINNNTAYFDVTFTNITNDMYAYDSVYKQNFYPQNGELTIYNYTANSTTIKFYSNNPKCREIYLGSKFVKFPIYNKYMNSDICKNMEGFSYCNKWVNKAYTYDEIKKAIDTYNAGNNKPEEKPVKVPHEKTFLELLLDIYVKYYVIILASVIILCLALIEIRKRTTRFKL